MLATGSYSSWVHDLPAKPIADQVRAAGEAAAPVWTLERRGLPADLVADILVWRAGMRVERANLRRTGPEQRSLLARTGQQRLERQLVTAEIHRDQQWADLLAEQVPNLINDSLLPSLSQRLDNLDRAGFDVPSLVHSAAAKGPLPDDHPAAALWWRILDELPLMLPSDPAQPTPAAGSERPEI